MVNFSGFRNRFFKKPNVVAPSSNVPKANVGPNSNLEKNVRAYVKGYLENRNTPNKLPVLNKSMVNALHKYINSKRARTAGVVNAALANAKAPALVAMAGGLAAGNVPLTATPSNAAEKVVTVVQGAGATPTQTVTAATATAEQQALQQGMTPAAAQTKAVNVAGATAAAIAQTPEAAAQIANKAVLAAGGNTANANKAAKLAALSAVLNKFNGKNNTWYSNQNLTTLNKEVNNASRNINLNANTRARLNIVKSRLKNAMKAKAPNTRPAGVMAQEQRPNANETGNNAPLVLNVNVPGTNNKVKVKRNSPGSNWYFANTANNAKYNLNNRNKNTPRVRNVGTGNLFKQGN